MNRTIVEGSTQGLRDVEAFLEQVGASSLFARDRPIVVARAPGRLDLMGGIADYSGSLVLQWPLSEATMAAVQRADDGLIRIVSRAFDETTERRFECSLHDLFPAGRTLAYDAAREWFAAVPDRRWAAYAAGALLLLAGEKDARPVGLRLFVLSSVPEGKGVSSSAALEVSVMRAMAAALGLDLGPRELAILCQKVENRIVGAACGVMDQMTSSCGQAGELLALLCQPAEIQGTIALPEDLEIWGLDSGERHAVSGSDYTAVRVGAFMGARILAECAGLRVTRGMTGGPVEVDDPRWHGFLANVTPSECESEFAGALPESLAGADFLERYGGTSDSVTRVDPHRTYAVRLPALHPIYEHARVRRVAELLRQRVTDRSAEELGRLMYESHASYSACGLGSPGTDLLVQLVREAGSSRGLYGAKITGGGSGGTVAVLGRRGADLQPVADAYAARTGRRPYIFSGSSPGAAAFGCLLLAERPSAG
jgi:L-arabinokinase